MAAGPGRIPVSLLFSKQHKTKDIRKIQETNNEEFKEK